MLRKNLLVLLLLLVAVSAAQAQAVGSLIFYANGGLWVLEAGAEQAQPLDFCMTPEREPMESILALSPDGTRIAFRAQPEIVTAAIERVGGIGGGELPANIWLCDLQAQTLTALAVQPDDASFFAEDDSRDNVIVHGVPEWSPDGRQLAWTQFRLYDTPLELVTYDLASGETVVVDQLPPQFAVPSTIPVQWGDAGIALVSYAVTEAPQALISIRVYDPETGGMVGELEFPQGYGTGAGEGLDGVYWVDNLRGGLAIAFVDGHFEVFTPEIGVAERVDGLELYSHLAGEGAQTLMYAPFTGDNVWAVRSGEIYTALPPSELYQLPRLAISPDGSTVAYVDTDNQVYLWDGTMASPVSLPEPVEPYSSVSLVWSPLGWRAYRGEVPQLGVTGEPVTCPGFMVSRLEVNQRGFVSDDLPNNLRAEPSSSSQRIGQIPGGAEFEVLAGPVCGEDLAWWQVDYNGLVGWTAEGQGDEYWLAPLS